MNNLKGRFCTVQKWKPTEQKRCNYCDSQLDQLEDSEREDIDVLNQYISLRIDDKIDINKRP